MEFTPVILAHVATAFGALSIGGTMLASKKGTASHRLLGRTWVALMLATALLSFGIRTTGHFSWIHLLSVWILFVLGMAMYSVFRRNIKAHRNWMTGGYIGLVLAGAFTLLPHRRFGILVWQAIGVI
ncbi:DUF2306 domain-containing protein [Noviherbaspirillum massiliense]|uniref:DUF2306 domain-containing protein n=1 Tax=Noviherbaspirillum massiliense TaxID=1465823 RepID=UPI0002F4EBD4|nr:DUF2306 domain-containing protein [Noviherbaspirillum massiliense]